MNHQARWDMQKFRASDGLTIAYALDDYTDPWRPADTLILVHAAMGSSKRFYAWVPHLARDFRVVRIDMRGHGQTEAPGPGQLDQQRIVKDVVELADQSARSASTSRVLPPARSSPRKSRSIIRTACCRSPHSPARAASGTRCRTRTPGSKKIGEKGLSAFLRETIADRVDLSTADPGFVDWFIEESSKTPVAVLERFVPMMREFVVIDDLHRIRCPVLAVAPGGDPIHTVDNYRALPDRIPGCEFIVYEGCRTTLQMPSLIGAQRI